MRIKNLNIRAVSILFILIFIAHLNGVAQQKYTPSTENIEARQWFNDARFGMFIHWGLYSSLAGGGKDGYAEWIQNRDFISSADYQKLEQFFNPQDFDPAAWVKMAKDAGMKYITFTTKHHEGFSMFDTQYSNFGIMHTPYKKDVLKMLKEECDKQGIKLFVYYSLLDWYNTDYYPWGRSGREYTGRPAKGEWNKYIGYMNNQLTELCTNYGEIGGVWFDGMWDRKDADWHLEEIYANIHKLQPQALIGNNHHKIPIAGEDFQMFERDLPGANTFGHNTTEISALPLESCETMNREWGYNFRDNHFKTSKEVIHLLVRAAGNNANLLLNTGPMPNGKIVPENIEMLKKVGEWTKTFGETIYGTKGGPEKPKPWGAMTQKDNKIFLHILDYHETMLVLPTTIGEISNAYWFGDAKTRVKITTTKDGVIVNLKGSNTDAIDRVIVLNMK